MIFGIYMYLNESDTYLRMDEVLDGRMYLIQARNSCIGIWNRAEKSFTIRRKKFGHVSLFPEYHWDTGEPYGTAKPYVLLDDVVGGQASLAALEALDTTYAANTESGFDLLLWRMLRAECVIRDRRIRKEGLPSSPTTIGKAGGPYRALGRLIWKERKLRRMTRKALVAWIRMSATLEVTAPGAALMVRELEDLGLVMNTEVLFRILHVLETNPPPKRSDVT